MVRVIQTLLTWYLDNHRKMPWRETTDPYKIWISEIILQQTRVQQGLPYYHRFIDNFNTVSELAMADESEVLKTWQGLGYYSRARNLHKAAKIIHHEFQGRFPENFDEIILLPGVGDYTASAIAAFAFNQKVVAIDGNVKRFASRWLGITIPVDKPAFIKNAKKELLDLLGDNPHSNVFNQAIIELGATICTPTNPNCMLCPLKNSCFAFAKNQQQVLPVTSKKIKPRPLNLVFFAINFSDQWLLIRRDESSVWANLFEFPNAEVENLETDPLSILEDRFHLVLSNAKLKILGYKDFKHQLSHRTIRARCWQLSCHEDMGFPDNWIVQSALKMGEVPVHRLMEKMMDFVGVWK
jgi:A/G-specific adenine glycosylase